MRFRGPLGTVLLTGVGTASLIGGGSAWADTVCTNAVPLVAPAVVTPAAVATAAAVAPAVTQSSEALAFTGFDAATLALVGGGVLLLGGGVYAASRLRRRTLDGVLHSSGVHLGGAVLVAVAGLAVFTGTGPSAVAATFTAAVSGIPPTPGGAVSTAAIGTHVPASSMPRAGLTGSSVRTSSAADGTEVRDATVTPGTACTPGSVVTAPITGSGSSPVAALPETPLVAGLPILGLAVGGAALIARRRALSA